MRMIVRQAEVPENVSFQVFKLSSPRIEIPRLQERILVWTLAYIIRLSCHHGNTVFWKPGRHGVWSRESGLVHHAFTSLMQTDRARSICNVAAKPTANNCRGTDLDIRRRSTIRCTAVGVAPLSGIGVIGVPRRWRAPSRWLPSVVSSLCPNTRPRIAASDRASGQPESV